jgi:uncharacterized DUF497 family protein
MNFEFDSKKARINLNKHGISFAELEPVFYDELALTREDEDALEQRFITVGLDAQLRLVAVCWTQRQENIRLISARLATSNERKAYENRI